MSIRTNKFLLYVSSALIIAGLLSSHAEAADDPRFFGTYCGAITRNLTVKVKFLGITIDTKRASVTVDFSANADYRTGTSRTGMVFGEGSSVVSSVTGDDEIRSRIPEGTTMPFVFSGVVENRGELNLTARASGSETYSTTVGLSQDGDRLSVPVSSEAVSISGMRMNIPPGFNIVLGKDFCGNSMPLVRIIAPASTSFLWGEPITFRAAVSDTEDTTFPQDRLVWSSDRDGRIGEGLSVRKNFLSPGTHIITFSATDSGGRIGTSEKRIVIQNNPPRAPRITSPSGSTFYVGQEITFRGWAQDRESGDLSGDALVWSSSLVSGPLGTGERIKTTLPEGDHNITLTATDLDGYSSRAFKSITVLPLPPGNTPPVVAIISPFDRAGMGDGECMTLVAEASDLQDGALTTDSIRWTGSYVQGGAVRSRNLGRGERVEMCSPPTTGRDTWHTISVEVRDSEGLRARDSIKVYVIPGGLI